MPPATVSLRVERQLLAGGALLVCGVDEVGRGALGGPVSVGMVVVDATVRRSLPGVRDSKLLTPRARTELVPRIRRWAVAYAVGHASAAEIDDVGIIAALRRAGMRALATLPVEPDAVLLDGKHDWLTPPRQDSTLRRSRGRPPCHPSRCGSRPTSPAPPWPRPASWPRSSGTRSWLISETCHPRYGWAGNKGYASPDHLAALQEHGPCVEHRRSWRLPVGHRRRADRDPPDWRETVAHPG